MYLLDTNVLVYAHNSSSPFYKIARSILGKVLIGKIEGCVALQNVYEFYSILTDPKRVERPLSSSKQTRKILQSFLAADNLPKIYPRSTNLATVIELLKTVKVIQQEIYDLVLVATIVENEVFGIYTADEKFFKKFDFLEVINPFK